MQSLSYLNENFEHIVVGTQDSLIAEGHCDLYSYPACSIHIHCGFGASFLFSFPSLLSSVSGDLMVHIACQYVTRVSVLSIDRTRCY